MGDSTASAKFFTKQPATKIFGAVLDNAKKCYQRGREKEPIKLRLEFLLERFTSTRSKNAPPKLRHFVFNCAMPSPMAQFFICMI